ncbi:MAG TPA: FG-GAP-like repeat-containing protein [Usitatibacter sp.]|nr:FG-GAP-like repeat-containing protein [Usitatibacter sp.]
MRVAARAIAIAGSILCFAVYAAPFTPGNLVIYRIGDGTATLTANGNAVFLDEYTASGGHVQSIAMPTTASGGDSPLAASGTATTDGHLTRSADGTCLAVPGYGRVVPTPGSFGNLVSGTTDGSHAIPRVVGYVTSAGTVSVTTALTDAAVADNFRGAATVDCSSFWVSGGTGTEGGLRYALRGATTSTDLSNSSTTALPFRVAQIFGGQLYVSTANASPNNTAARGVSQVGAGLPTSASQTITKLPGFSNTNSTSPYGYFFADLDGTVPGVDTLYVADDGAAAVTKFSLVGGTWVSNGVIGVDADDFRSIVGVVNGTSVTLYAVKGGNRLVTLTDSSGYNGAFSGSFADLATPVAAGANQAFRGVALAPVLSATPVQQTGGTVSPSTAQAVVSGGQVDFTVTPDSGFVAQDAGTCGGSFISDTVFRTAAVTASCIVTFSFARPEPPMFAVTSSAGSNGTISPLGTQNVQEGETAAFTVTPDSGYGADVSGSCGGTLSGTTYTTNPVTAPCTVDATFSPLPFYPVTPSSSAHGTLSPSDAQSVQQGQSISFTVTPDEGYHGAVRGTCPGSWTDSTTYTVNAVSGPCTVQATFATKLVLFVGNSYTFGRADPVMSYNTANVTDLTWAMWLANPTGTNDDEPHPWGGIPGIFKKFVDEAGLDWDVSISARNAATLRGHYLNSNPAGWDLRGNVATQPYTTVVLQDQSDEPLPSGRGANANLAYFDAYVGKLVQWAHVGAAETYTESQLFGSNASCQAQTGASSDACDTVRVISPANVNANPAADIYLYATWARPDMIAPNGTTGPYYTAAEGLEAMTADLQGAYVGAAQQQAGQVKAVSPVGNAFLIAVQQGFAMRDPYAPEADKLDLWYTDFFHPSKYGSYLSALVQFAMMTGIDPMALGDGEQAAADLGIESGDATDLQLIAHLAVVPPAPSIHQLSAGNQSITAQIDAPDTFGLPLTFYRLTCDGQVVQGTGPTLTLSGVTNGVTETCTVAVRNGVGYSNESAPETITPSAVTIVDDFDGNGHSDIAFQNDDGRVNLWLMDGASHTGGGPILGPGTGWSVARIADLDGDGKMDIVWQNADGRIAAWTMNGAAATSTSEIVAAGPWSVAAVADLDTDHKADIVFRNTDGSYAAYLMNGTSVTSGTTILPAGTGWTLAGAALNTLVWQHTDGRVAVWRMDGLAINDSREVLGAGTGWTVSLVASDGIFTKIFFHHTDGRVALWDVWGTVISDRAELIGPGTGWNVTGTGDFDGDGHADLLWTNDDGRVAIWLTDGDSILATSEILPGGTGWSVRRVDDLDGDGKSDLVWQHTDGSVAVWLMNGTSMASGVTLLGPGGGWHVQPQPGSVP